MSNVVIRGLPLLALMLLVGGCASSTCDPCPAPCDPCPAPCEPRDVTPRAGVVVPASATEYNPCSWPEKYACGDMTAAEILDELERRATSAPDDWFHGGADKRESIVKRIGELRSPDLRSKDGIHVCNKRSPDPGTWLVELLDHAPVPPGMSTATPEPEEPVEEPVEPESDPPAPEDGESVPVKSEVTPETARDRWETIATDLASFPTGPKTVQPQ